MGNGQHAVVPRPGHDAGQRRDHTCAKLTFRLATKGDRIIAPGLAPASRGLMCPPTTPKCHSRRSSNSSKERPSPMISSAVHRARPNGDEYAWSKEMPRALNAARVASACSRPRAVSGESCQPCKMLCTLSSVCPCRTKIQNLPHALPSYHHKGDRHLCGGLPSDHAAVTLSYTSTSASGRLGTWCTCASSRQ